MTTECSFYCTSDSYNFMTLSEYLQNKSIQYKVFGKDVLHIEGGESNEIFDIFIYSYGCVVFWGLNDSKINEFLKEYQQFANDPLKHIISDKCKYEIMSHDLQSFIDLENDIIVINKEKNMQLTKLAFSYGLSQSVKLSVFEDSVDKTIEENKSIPADLIQTGKISLSKEALAKKIGSLFAERNYINLNNNILDTPEFFWKHPKYEQFYEMSIKFLDLTQRIHVLNSKLDIIRDLYSILSDELKHAHSSRLEVTVIILIFLEICVGLLSMFLGIKH